MAVAGKVTRAWRQPNAWFMASVTGGLTVPGRDQFRNPALVSNMEQPLPFNLLTYLLICSLNVAGALHGAGCWRETLSMDRSPRPAQRTPARL